MKEEYPIEEELEEAYKEIDRLTAESTEWESKSYQLQDIIKEVREYITSIKDEDIQYTIGWVKQDILQILDKENK